jgi:glucan 1,3-beta-glucosidase
VANTDCAKWLNGRGTGSRYDNTLNGTAAIDFPGDCSQRTGDPSAWTQGYIDHLAQAFETQTWVYEKAVSRTLQGAAAGYTPGQPVSPSGDSR